MKNKKVLLVIILFIGISFIVYSFANPLAEEDQFMTGDGNTGITDNNTGNNDNPVIDNSDIVDNNDAEEPEEPITDDNEGKEDGDNNSGSQGNQGSQIVQTGTQNSANQSTTKYYCKYVNGKYYGSAGSVVSYSTFVSQCDSKTPTLSLKQTFNEPYTVTLGTSKNLSDFYSSSFGTLGGSVTCKNGNAVIKNLNELKSSGTYTITCTATGGNGKTSGSVSIPVRIKPLANVTASLGKFDRESYEYLGVTVTNNVKLVQSGSDIKLSGTMITQYKKQPFNSTKYLTINYVGERKYTDEELANAQFSVNNVKYTIDGRNNTQLISVGTTTAGKSYISFEGNFSEGFVSTVKINWGDGNGDYTYKVHYDVTVLSIDDINQSIKDQLGIVDPE